MIQGPNITSGIHSLPMDISERKDGGSACEHGQTECSDSPEDNLSKKNQTPKAETTHLENDLPKLDIFSPGRSPSAVNGMLEANGALFESGELAENGTATKH